VDRVNIVLTNTKGGVGKSTIAVHLAVWLHDLGVKVALLDMDKQRSSACVEDMRGSWKDP
jgi:chromosome partitioning protein